MAKRKKKINWFKFLNVRHGKRKIAGQELPSSMGATPKWVLYSIVSLSAFIWFTFIYLLSFIIGATVEIKDTGFNKAFADSHLFSLKIIFSHFPPVPLVFIGTGVITIIGLVLYKKFAMRFNKLDRGQKGDMRFLTQKEIETNFPSIPEVADRFEGYGGMPISHYRAYYYIDQATSNSVIIGISRSGKTEMYIFPLIDNLSRGKKQASMVINDVKKEILRGTQQMLENRRYETFSLDLIDPYRSISVQLIYIIIFYWQLGEKDQAELLINSLTYTIYCSPKDNGTTKHFNETAQGVINAVILSFLEMADKEGTFEKVTMYNVSQFMVEMGMERWRFKGDPKEYNALDLYFEKLPAGSSAKAQYASTNFAGDKEKGSIMSTAIRGLRIFQLKSIAKLTSDNTLDFKKLGFPKDVILHFDPILAYKKIQLVFRRGNMILGKHVVEPSISGVAMYFHDYDMKKGDVIDVAYPINEKEWTKTTIEIEKIYQHDPNYSKDYRVDVDLINKHDLLNKVTMSYCDHPIALFLCVADEDKSLHPITSIIISQIYQLLIKLCSYSDNGNQLFRRLHMILEEFGNMAIIPNLPNYVTASLGRGILWNFFVQGYHQFYKIFGKEDGKLIIDNCQNVLYVMSKDKDTVTEIYNNIGKKTIEESSISDKATKIDANRSRKVTAEDVIQTTRLQTLLQGETVAITGLNRKDNKGRLVRPFPIFNTQETSMPLRHEFRLMDYIDTHTPLAELNTPCTHRYLDLTMLEWDYDQIKAQIGVPYFALSMPENDVEIQNIETIEEEIEPVTKEEILLKIKDILWEESALNKEQELKFVDALEKNIIVTVKSLMGQCKEGEMLGKLVNEYQLLS